MTLRDKVARKACWDAKDHYWACLDQQGHSMDQCVELRRLLEVSCPSQWVKHFDRKWEYLQFRERLHAVGRIGESTSNCLNLSTSIPKRQRRVYRTIASS